MKVYSLALGSLLLVTSTTSAFGPAQSPKAAAAEPRVAPASPLVCDRVSFPVTLGPLEVEVYRVRGELCVRGQLEGRTIQVLLSGATYDRSYWDFIRGTERYSYVRVQTGAGFATLNLDRIGLGESDHPPAAAVTVQSNAHVVHQVLEQLRSGDVVLPALGQVLAERIVLVGHSLGSAVAALEAATYQDVDGVVLTGFLHNEGPAAPEVALAFHPTVLDPQLGDQDLPLGYLTTIPGERSRLFYEATASAAAIRRRDEATKSTITPGELGDSLSGYLATFDIRVPTLVVVGDRDAIFCDAPSCTEGGTLTREATYYPPEACLMTLAVPDMGHVLNLHRRARRWQADVAAWIDAYVGLEASAEPCQPES